MELNGIKLNGNKLNGNKLSELMNESMNRVKSIKIENEKLYN